MQKSFTNTKLTFSNVYRYVHRHHGSDAIFHGQYQIRIATTLYALAY